MIYHYGDIGLLSSPLSDSLLQAFSLQPVQNLYLRQSSPFSLSRLSIFTTASCPSIPFRSFSFHSPLGAPMDLLMLAIIHASAPMQNNAFINRVLCTFAHSAHIVVAATNFQYTFSLTLRMFGHLSAQRSMSHYDSQRNSSSSYLLFIKSCSFQSWPKKVEEKKFEMCCLLRQTFAGSQCN